MQKPCRYGVGGLSVINACAGCYSEDLPVVFVSGEDSSLSRQLTDCFPYSSCSCMHAQPDAVHIHIEMFPDTHYTSRAPGVTSRSGCIPTRHPALQTQNTKPRLAQNRCFSVAAHCQAAPTPTTLPATTQCTTPLGSLTWASSTGHSRRSPAMPQSCSTSQRHTTR
jgi:hypothetical protein